MALYDNKHWLLSNIRESFITTDDSGMSEAVMVSDNIAKQLPTNKLHRYPCAEELEDMDGCSFEYNSDSLFGLRRHRSNTAQRLERMDREKRKAANTVHIKWIMNPNPLTDSERAELFPRKDLESIKKTSAANQVPVLTELLQQFPEAPLNPYKEYAKLDGNAQVGVPMTKFSIFITMLNELKRSYPMVVYIVSSAKILDLVGLTCWKCSLEHPDLILKDGVQNYGLFIAEEDGQIDWEFPPLDNGEVVAKFGFIFLAIAELESAKELDECFPLFPDHQNEPVVGSSRAHQEAQLEEDMNKIKGHINAIEASVYQSFNVNLLNKVRAKKEIHLGVSCEKLEMIPVIQQRVSARILGGKRKASMYYMNDIIACKVLERKTKNNRSTFKLLYYHRKQGTSTSDDTGYYKHKYFESDTTTAKDIVTKINHILEVRRSEKREEYKANCVRKSRKKKNSLLGGSR